MRIGSHVPANDPLGAAAADGAECLQVFLGNPQSWRKPAPRDDAEELRASALPLYVHAPYLVNVASAESRIRVPSRRILQETCDAAAAVGAAAVIVHGGTVTGDEDVAAGYGRWRKALQQVDTDVAIYIENTAGGDNSVARTVASIRRLWEEVGDLGPRLCFDTCHAHSAGLDLVEAVVALTEAVGGIALTHCNDSRDEAGSGRDRHEHLGKGTIDPDVLVAAVRHAGADVIVETGEDGRADDLRWLHERL